MKRKFIFAAALTLFLTACESGSFSGLNTNYPDIKYTNTTDIPVKFWIAEKEAREILLAPYKSITLSSEIRGRTQLAGIETPLVIWEYHENNVHDIRLLKNGISLEIRNYSEEKYVVNEKNGYISIDDIWPVEAALEPRKGGKFYSTAGNNLKLFTDKPIWIISPDKRFELKRVKDIEGNIVKYILGIDPPWDDKEWDNL